MPSGIITLLTDFGTADAFVGIMKGIILGINRQAQVVDLTHGIPPQQILPGALVLRSAVRFFPVATVHVAVIDPGVGSARRPIVIETPQGFLVGPDNGVLSPAVAVLGCRQVRLSANMEYVRQPVSQTFHGRDIFAPVAAHLSRGVAPDRLGPRIDSIVELTVPEPRSSASSVRGEVIYVDHFGALQKDVLDMLSGKANPAWDAQELVSVQSQLTANAQRLMPAINQVLNYVHQRTLQRLTLEAATTDREAANALLAVEAPDAGGVATGDS
jgi:S-adenosylmethionine hydrolase